MYGSRWMASSSIRRAVHNTVSLCYTDFMANKKPQKVTVTSQYFAGKTVNVPHTEHAADAVKGDVPEKGTVTFGADGKAKVSPELKAALVQFFPRHIS